MWQDGNGTDPASALVRDPRMLWGLGYLQLLRTQLALRGDARLAFPFGWKGRASTIAGFVEGGFQVHFGMASVGLVQKHQALMEAGSRLGLSRIVGDGSDPADPDGDGVRDEVTLGEIAAVALWLALQPTPVQDMPKNAEGVASVDRGTLMFRTMNCTGCHVPSHVLDSPLYPVTGGGAAGWNDPVGLVVDLTTAGFGDQPAAQADGTVPLQVYSDFQLHDMGASMADSHDTFGDDALFLPETFPSSPRHLFLTTPLWGVAVTAPYLHDGRAATLREAILAHDGEAADSTARFRNASAEDQQAVLDFLGTLTWHEAPLP